eukprot:3941657-Rhodomonas_salina.2
MILGRRCQNLSHTFLRLNLSGQAPDTMQTQRALLAAASSARKGSGFHQACSEVPSRTGGPRTNKAGPIKSSADASTAARIWDRAPLSLSMIMLLNAADVTIRCSHRQPPAENPVVL